VKWLEWAGRLIRTSENRTIKKIFNTRPEGTRKLGRPKLNWEECVCQDIRILGVKNWRNREEWRIILRKARAPKGCRASDDDDDDDDDEFCVQNVCRFILKCKKRRACKEFPPYTEC
jgi:hypothetical protein